MIFIYYAIFKDQINSTETGALIYHILIVVCLVVPIILTIRYAMRRCNYPKLRESELNKALIKFNQRFAAKNLLCKSGRYGYWIEISHTPNLLAKKSVEQESSPTPRLDSLGKIPAETLLSGN